MARKRKKYPKLPNGYGSISYLGGNRRNPYAVYPPATEYYTESGQMKHPKALCYVRDWNVGFAVLTAYKAGTYQTGMEKELNEMILNNGGNINDLAQKLLSDYTLATRADRLNENICPTFADVYEKYFDWKYNGKKKFSKQSEYSTNAAFKNCSVLHNRKMNEITYTELQDVIDSCTLKHASLELMVSLIKQMFKFSIVEGIVASNPTELLKINIEDDDEHGVPFTDGELKILWKHKDDKYIEAILIMIYSGYRIGELAVIDVDLKNKCFSGGLKTKTSKERIVPIHSAILPLVKHRIAEYGALMNCNQINLRNGFSRRSEKLKLSKHTPHDCRHTFSALCERYNVNENDRKRMLGHSFGSDVTNAVYGHRTIDELRIEIEKIKKI